MEKQTKQKEQRELSPLEKMEREDKVMTAFYQTKNKRLRAECEYFELRARIETAKAREIEAVAKQMYYSQGPTEQDGKVDENKPELKNEPVQEESKDAPTPVENTETTTTEEKKDE